MGMGGNSQDREALRGQVTSSLLKLYKLHLTQSSLPRLHSQPVALVVSAFVSLPSYPNKTGERITDELLRGELNLSRLTVIMDIYDLMRDITTQNVLLIASVVNLISII